MARVRFAVTIPIVLAACATRTEAPVVSAGEPLAVEVLVGGVT